MSAEDLEQYENEQELALYREYRDVVGLFRYVVETERRFYLCNAVDMTVRGEGADVFFDVTMQDAWVWDIYRPARFVKNVRVVTFKDVNVEELAKNDLEIPDGPGLHELNRPAWTLWRSRCAPPLAWRRCRRAGRRPGASRSWGR